MPSPQLNRVLWAVMLTVLALLAYQFEIGAYLGRGTLTVARDPADERTVVLRWRGSIEPPMQARLAEAFKAHRGDADRFVLSLSSPGGSVSHGRTVVLLLGQIKRGHKLETVVEGANTCASMCVPVYLQGEVRRATARSRWLFHEVRRFDAITDEVRDTTPADRQALTDRLFATYFKPAGVSPVWIAKTRTLMRDGDVWRTGAQLVEQGAGIIQALQ